MTSPESGPTSPQADAASVDWSPRIKLISNITNSANAVVTTTFDHHYKTGMYVLINVLPIYGMQLNAVVTPIVVIAMNAFSTNINTLNQPSFTPPVLTAFTPAQVSPITGHFFNSTPGSPQGNPTGGVQ
jgi:hypothetical protein